MNLMKRGSYNKRKRYSKGVYGYETAKGTRYIWETWNKGVNNKRTGGKAGYVDPLQAAYDRRVFKRGHHWQGMPKSLDDFFGFTYRITEKATGRMYLGAKQFYYWDGPVRGYKCTDPRDPDWDISLWRDGEWQTYQSSSKPIHKLINEKPWLFEFEVVRLHHNKLDLFHAELEQQIEADVLNTVDDNGDYVYLNEQIMGVEYRPPVPKARLRAAKEAAETKVRDYYLRPSVCDDCGEVIPYGERRCPSAALFGNGGCNERMANG